MSRKPVLHEYDSIPDYDPNNFNFQIGAPHPTELIECSKIVQSAIQSIAKQDDYLQSSCFQYGTETGSDPARQALSKFLSDEHGFNIPVENLMVTCGASLTLTLVCNQFFGWEHGQHQPIAFVEHPTYFLALDMLEGLGFKIIPIPRIGNGEIDFDAWESLSKQYCISDTPPNLGNKLWFRALVYLIPTFHNPTGTCLSPETSSKLIEFCERENLLVHCDDVYNLLYYSSTAPRRHLPVGRTNHIVSAGSFSKLLGPGLRIGWLESSPDIIHKVASSGVVVSGGCLNQFGSYLIERSVDNGDLPRHVKDLRVKYKAKMDAFERVFQSSMPKGVTWERPQGGYFIWIRLPPGNERWIVDDLVPQARALGIKFQLGTRSCTARRVGEQCTFGCENAIRISIGHVTVQQVEEGMTKLSNLLSQKLNK